MRHSEKIGHHHGRNAEVTCFRESSNNGIAGPTRQLPANMRIETAFFRSANLSWQRFSLKFQFVFEAIHKG